MDRDGLRTGEFKNFPGKRECTALIQRIYREFASLVSEYAAAFRHSQLSTRSDFCHLILECNDLHTFKGVGLPSRTFLVLWRSTIPSGVGVRSFEDA